MGACVVQAPIILRESTYTKTHVEPLKEKAELFNDIYPLQIKELIEIQNPEKIYEQNFTQE